MQSVPNKLLTSVLQARKRKAPPPPFPTELALTEADSSQGECQETLSPLLAMGAADISSHVSFSAVALPILEAGRGATAFPSLACYKKPTVLSAALEAKRSGQPACRIPALRAARQERLHRGLNFLRFRL